MSLRIEVRTERDDDQPALGAYVYGAEDFATMPVGVDRETGQLMRAQPDYLGGIMIYLGRREIDIRLYRDLHGA